MAEYFLGSLAGYVLGRLGHIFGGQVWFIPHHWIFGVVFIIVPIFLRKISWKTRVLIILFGLGVFVSDFNDFLHLKTFEPESVQAIKFWGID